VLPGLLQPPARQVAVLALPVSTRPQLVSHLAQTVRLDITSVLPVRHQQRLAHHAVLVSTQLLVRQLALNAPQEPMLLPRPALALVQPHAAVSALLVSLQLLEVLRVPNVPLERTQMLAHTNVVLARVGPICPQQALQHVYYVRLELTPRPRWEQPARPHVLYVLLASMQGLLAYQLA